MAGNRPNRHRTVELHLPSELGWERAAMDLVQSVATDMGFPLDRIEDIKTAVAEATVNAIEHGHAQDKTHKVVVDLYPNPEDEKLEISVRDRSTTPFPAEAPEGPPDLAAKLAGLEQPRGWGMFLIRTLVDEVEFSSTGRGNVVRMIVHLDPPSGEVSESPTGSSVPGAKNAE